LNAAIAPPIDPSIETESQMDTLTPAQDKALLQAIGFLMSIYVGKPIMRSRAKDHADALALAFREAILQ
jgi:hypothetical protein